MKRIAMLLLLAVSVAAAPHRRHRAPRPTTLIFHSQNRECPAIRSKSDVPVATVISVPVETRKRWRRR